MRFTITIDLGNAAMQTRHELADSIDELVADLRGGYVDIVGDGARYGRLRDINGNKVGEWRVEKNRNQPDGAQTDG